MQQRKMNFREKIRAYKLGTQVTIAWILMAVFVISFAAYQFPAVRKAPVASELVLALFTSILVSVVTLVVSIIVEFNRHKADAYLESIREFGIGNLFINKENVLRELLSDCDSKIWISGYRLILTKNLKNDIYNAIKRGADFYGLICPPWTEAFKMVYGANEKVIDNYLDVFYSVSKARKELGGSARQIKIVFVNKPIFSDTYRVDQRLIAGPYMHNRDEEDHAITAKDFFSYDLVRKSRLSDLIDAEYRTLYKEAESELDLDKFDEVYAKIRSGDFCEADKIKLFMEACIEHTPEDIL